MPVDAEDRFVVAVVEDYELVLMGLRHILTTQSARPVLVELDNRTTQGQVREPVDIVLIDPVVSVAGEDQITALVAEPRVAHVIVFSWNFTDPAVQRAMRLGVHGYLSKSLPAAKLVAALEQIHAGKIVTEGPFLASGPTSPPPKPGTARLSEREAEVLWLIVQGKSNHEIANIAHLSANTLKSYIRSLYRKIGVATRPQAVLWGLNNRHPEPPTKPWTRPPETNPVRCVSQGQSATAR